VVEAQVSTDGTRKWLLKTHDGHDFEMVFIPDADRGTLCVSSQVGCTLNCRFCHTGTMRWSATSSRHEIVGQVMLARDALGEWPSQPEGRMLTNIVMMGMGEPLYNFDNVRDALKIVMDGDGLGLSKRRITLSTSGVVPMMERCGEEIGVNLAVSLHAVTKEIRDEIVPAEPQVRHRGAAAGLRRLSRRQQCPPDHVRICDAQGQERQRRACARAGAADPPLSPAGQGQPDPVQPVAGAPYECSTPERIRAFSTSSSKAASPPRSAPRAAATSTPPAAS
jgi:23S rRNA (adenine2503-C2)-methyltransferase